MFIALESIQALPKKLRQARLIHRGARSWLFGRRPEFVGKPREGTGTHGIAERAVMKIKEGTSTALMQSGLTPELWAEAQSCFLLSLLRHRSHARRVYSISDTLATRL